MVVFTGVETLCRVASAPYTIR